MLNDKPDHDTKRCVYRAWSLFQARLALEALRSEGIDADIRNKKLVTSIGMIPPQEAMIEVWVNETHQAQAEHLLREIFYGDAKHPIVGRGSEHDGDAPRQEPTHCPACGAPWEEGYDTCWKCCTPLVEHVRDR